METVDQLESWCDEVGGEFSLKDNDLDGGTCEIEGNEVRVYQTYGMGSDYEYSVTSDLGDMDVKSGRATINPEMGFVKKELKKGDLVPRGNGPSISR